MKDRMEILNLWVDPVDPQTAIERVKHFIEHTDRPQSIFAVNPEKNFSVPKDPALWDMFRSASLLIPDGIGVVVAARILHGARLGRVPGADFMEKICQLSAAEGYKVYIYGGKEEINRKAAEVLTQRYPRIQIVGRSNGYVKDEDMPALVDRINQSQAAVLFLALGSPKQEKWFATYRDQLKTVRVCQGIGGTLDTIVGNVKRAPETWQKLNLEWLYRLLSEPSRIRRQKVLPWFAVLVLWAKLKSLFGMKKEKGVSTM